MSDISKEREQKPDEKNGQVTLKRSAKEVLDGYYKRRYNMYKEIYENGSTSR